MSDKGERWHAPALFPDEVPGAVVRFDWILPLVGTVTVGGSTYAMPDPLTVHAELIREAESVSLVLSIDGLVVTACGRCLAQIGVAIRDDFMYSFVSRSRSDELEEDAPVADGPDDEAVLVPVDRLSGPIDLGDLVWECFVCSLPPYAACEGGCAREIYPSGATVDPRLQVFADLFENGEGGNE